MKKSAYVMALLPVLCTIFLVAQSCGKKTDNGGGTPITPTPPVKPAKSDVTMWLTNANQSQLLTKQDISLNFATGSNGNQTIAVDTATTYQSIDGFGFCLTGGSASVINALPAATADALLKELFLTDSTHIGISYLRISIGASDMSAQDFTYDDIASGTDVNLDHFSIDMEKTDLIP